MRQGAGAIQALGPVAARRTQEPADRGKNPRRDQRRQARRRRARSPCAGADDADDLLTLPPGVLTETRSALPAKEDIVCDALHVRFVPLGHIVPYSITSSAVNSSFGGTVRPSALTVLRLMISSNLVGCWIGR